MPHFNVILNGAGVALELEGQLAVGFFTTRKVRATDPEQAAAKASDAVAAEWWPRDPYASGGQPRLTVEEVVPLGLVKGWFGKSPRGYSFYLFED